MVTTLAIRLVDVLECTQELFSKCHNSALRFSPSDLETFPIRIYLQCNNKTNRLK